MVFFLSRSLTLLPQISFECFGDDTNLLPSLEIAPLLSRLCSLWPGQYTDYIIPFPVTFVLQYTSNRFANFYL